MELASFPVEVDSEGDGPQPYPIDADELTHSFNNNDATTKSGAQFSIAPPANRASVLSRTSLDRTGTSTKGRSIDEAIDEYFDDFLDITAPLLPVQTLFISFHIVQKRARQFLDDARFFAMQQCIWMLTALVGLIVPKNTNSTIEFLSEVYFALVLVMSSLEMILYIIGHGFLASEKFGRTAPQLRVLAVLGVWSPPRFRRKGDIAVQHYQVQLPLLSNSFMRLELCLVILSIVGYFLDFDGFGRVRFVHILRCARLIYGLSNIWPLMVRVIATFQSALSGMATALVLLVFFFILFGITGVDQFTNSLSNRCVLDPIPKPYSSYNRSEICLDGVGGGGCVEANPSLNCDIAGQNISFTAPFLCRGNMVCRTLDPPNFGYTSYNDFFHASLLMIQLTSLSDWGTFLYGVWMSNPQIIIGIYNAALIIIVSYVVLNFVVATICSAYSENRKVNTGYNKFRAISLLNFRFTEFVWWTISIDAQYYLTYSNPTARHQNRRSPFYDHRNYKIARDLWMTLIVASHATLTSSASSGHVSYLHAIEIVNMVLFSLDVVVSNVAAGSLGKYLLEEVHRFDLLAFILTIIGLIIGTPLSVFRFILVGHWLLEIPTFRNSRVIQQGLVAAPGTLLASLVLLLLLFVSASVAVQLFSVDDDTPNDDWSDAWQSIVTLFRFVTLDGWATIMYDAMELRGPVLGLGFFLPTYIMFGYMIRGLFTAVVVDAFDPNTEEKLAWQQKVYRHSKRHGLLGDGAGGTGTMSAIMLSGNHREPEAYDGDIGGAASPLPKDIPTSAADTYGAQDSVRKAIVDSSFFYFRLNHPVRRFLLRLLTIPSELIVPPDVVIPPGGKAAALVDKDEDAVVPASLLIPYRTYGNYFQFIIILCVLGSCVTAADPAKEACSSRGDLLKRDYAFTSYVSLDGVFVAIFTIEMLIRMIAFGVAMRGDDRPWYIGPPYFQDPWNVLDFLLLLIMYISFFYPEVAALRLLRILRPLRIIRRFRRMRQLMSGVVIALPGIVVTLVCGAVLLFLFAIVGVSQFRGKMDTCSVQTIAGAAITMESECVGMLFGDNGVLVHAVWENQDPNFDSVVLGMSYLIQIISLSSWTELLSRATSVTDANKQPQQKAALQNSLYFFVFVILANSYILNIIVGVVVAAFDEQQGLKYLTLPQRMYKTLRENIESMRKIPPPPSTRFPKLLALVRWSGFDPILNIVVMLNIGVLLSTYAGQSEQFTNIQFYLNTMFTFVFVVEACLKLLALGVNYFFDLWNNLDCAIVAGSIVEFSIQMASSGQAVTITSVGRAFRILRVFRSVRRIPSLQMMFSTLANSTPAILSIFGVMIMVVFMYSVVGMQFFGHLRYQTNINLNSNFRNFLTGWFAVFRMLTLDHWDLMMSDAATYVGDLCNSNQNGWWYMDPAIGVPQVCGVLNDCGSTITAQVYFFSFYILSAFIFSSVVIAILLDSFRLSSSSSRAVVRPHDLEGYRLAWLKARRAVGENNFYGDHLEKELMSLLVITMFNDNNGLVLNRVDATKHIHPALTSRTRLNLRKIIYELDYMTNRDREQLRKKLRFRAMQASKAALKKSSANASSSTGDAIELRPISETPVGTPSASPLDNATTTFDALNAIDEEVQTKFPLGKYSFHDIIECLCRFQMGHDALPIEQKVSRETFDDKMNVAMFSAAIKSNLLTRLKEARQRLQLYELDDAPPLLLDAAVSIEDVIAMKKLRSTLHRRQSSKEEERELDDEVGGSDDRGSLPSNPDPDNPPSPFARDDMPSPRGDTGPSVVAMPTIRLPQPAPIFALKSPVAAEGSKATDPRSILKKSSLLASPQQQPRGAGAVFTSSTTPTFALPTTRPNPFRDIGVEVQSDDEVAPSPRTGNHVAPLVAPKSHPASLPVVVVVAQRHTAGAEERTGRLDIELACVVEVEEMHRGFLESQAMRTFVDLHSDCKRAWIRLLFDLRTTGGASFGVPPAAHVNPLTAFTTPQRKRWGDSHEEKTTTTLQSFPNESAIASNPTSISQRQQRPTSLGNSGSSIQPKRNPIASLEVPAVMCADDYNCPLYHDPRHTKARRHTCRKGAQCHDYSSQHAAQYLHPIPAEIEILSSDDEMLELSF